MTGEYFLDGVDMYTAYGFNVASGKNDFLRLPELKEPYSHNWGDANGIEYDLSNPVFQQRTATLRGHLSASGLIDFEAKHSALFQALKSPGEHILTIPDINQSYKIFYRSNPVVENKTGAFKQNKRIYLYIELVFEIIGGGYIDAGLGNFYFGPVTAFPLSWNPVQQLDGFQTEGQSNIINLNTGSVERFFVFVARSARTINRIVDLNSSNENLTPLYTVRGTVTSPENTHYKVYGMSLLLPYLVNHVHQITMN